MSIRRLEHADEAKFWEAWIKDDLVYCYRYGKLGASGHTKIKKFKTRAEAEVELVARLEDKLREGFAEVGAPTDTAPSKPARKTSAEPAKSAPVPIVPPPPRLERRAVSAEAIGSAQRALDALASAVGGRSWKVARNARIARRALEQLGGVDPSAGPLASSFEALMDRVLATKPRLPLEQALGLLWEIDAVAYAAVVGRWRAKMLASPAAASIALLGAVFDAVDDPEVAVHAGAALVERRLPPVAWKRRFDKVRPSFDSALRRRGSSLESFLSANDPDDPVLRARIRAVGEVAS